MYYHLIGLETQQFAADAVVTDITVVAATAGVTNADTKGTDSECCLCSSVFAESNNMK